MKLVIDTNTIISALIKKGISRRIIVTPFINYLTPDYTLQEISKYEKLICKKAMKPYIALFIIFSKP